jgi:hypothetical protein
VFSFLIPQYASAIVNETGSFYQFLLGYEPGTAYDNWVSHISEGLVSPGYNAYAPWDRQTNGFGSFVYPDSTMTDQWNVVSGYFADQEWTQCSNALLEYSLPYDLVHFTDTDTGRRYYMLREWLNRDYDDNGTETLTDDECGSFDLGWGLFVFNPDSTNPIITTVPHPNDDFIAIPLAWKAFTQLNTRFLMINGAGREVMWTNQGPYTNSSSLSDPSRNPFHPFHQTYKVCCDDIRVLMGVQNSLLGREFSLQVHSYDTSLHVGFANCQVSAGYGQSCINLPTRDLSQTQPDLINAAGYLIHPANSIGNNTEVTTSNFWAVNYNQHHFYFNDGTHAGLVSNYIDLPGYSQNCQMQYTLNQWTNYDVYDPFFHIEMDELPDCYAQNDSTLAWFYSWNSATSTWDERTRYRKVMAYYQPWIDALEISLQHTLPMNDNHTPTTPVLTSAAMVSNSTLRLIWQNLYEYDFSTWSINLERRIYLGNGNYIIIDTLKYDRTNHTSLADQANTTIDLSSIPAGYHYRIWMTATDKSNRRSALSNQLNIVTYISNPLVTNVHYDRTHSDEHQITIRWTAIPENIVVSNYRIERRFLSDFSWDYLALLPQSANTYSDHVFSLPDTLDYEYRVSTIGANGMTYYPSTTITGYLRCYPAPVLTNIPNPASGQRILSWQPIHQTQSGTSDNPDYYLIKKSSAVDFTAADTQIITVTGSAYHDTSPIADNCFYQVTAKAGLVPIRER